MPHSTYLPERMGTATVAPRGAFEAGSLQEFTLVYTAGTFGIDDTGSIKIVHRFASDMGRPQFADPAAPNYVTAEASNGAALQLEYDAKRNIRPWDKTLHVRVLKGFLREGDTITVRFGDRRKGSPGMRVQTFVEPTFEFRVLVDAFATYDFVELPEQPTIAIVAGPPAAWRAILPTLRRIGESFALGFKGEDRWGNPSDRVDGRFRLHPSIPVAGLPREVALRPGRASLRIDGLRVDRPGLLRVEVEDESGRVVCASNPLLIVERAELVPYWADLHGQSEETIGTNSARELLEFARDRAFLDAMSHQGNDFQITTPFWNELNRLTAEFNADGRFVVFPGYEWSGNTGLGGDRNVLFRHEGRAIRRSSHALVADRSDAAHDAHSAESLFRALVDEDCVVFAHIGGRYADIRMAHDVRLERSVEIHSDWGTFEWLLEDAFDQGYRVGVLANSDGHKGRHGASHPGASLFGAYGGLSCLLARALSRDALFECLRARRHYATTGCRLHLDVTAALDAPAFLHEGDPALGTSATRPVDRAMMGDIVSAAGEAVTLRVAVHAQAPIERIEIRNGKETIETWRPFGPAELGSRVRVIWEGAEVRGRGRQTVWDGTAEVRDNAFVRVEPINFWNLDRKLDRVGDRALRWQALTTGGFGGFEAVLAISRTGSLHIDTAPVKAEVPVAEIGLDDRAFEAGGLGRRIRVFRLPDRNPTRCAHLERRLPLRRGRDNPLYVALTTEDGHRAWSSPIYVIA
jgi:hypothetical protein